MGPVRLMHLINQFFAGIGGEDKADTPVGSKKGIIGPGKPLQDLLGHSASIVVTAYCGDNYFAEKHDEALKEILQIARDNNVQMVVAGPAFAAGRYGFTCVEVCHFLSTSLGLDCIIGMHSENPAVEGYQQYKDRKVLAIPTGDAVSRMGEALQKMALVISKLASGSAIGSASEEGYIPRGFRVVSMANKSGADRGVDMLLSKVAGQTYVSEIPIQYFEEVPIPSRIADLTHACLALATTSGLVIQGNPDGFKMQRNTQWKKYSIEKLNSMKEAKWDIRHGGYNHIFMLENPNYGVPLDACRELVKERKFAKLYPFFYTTPGINGLTEVMERLGAEIASDMKEQGVDGAILVAT